MVYALCFSMSRMSGFKSYSKNCTLYEFTFCKAFKREDCSASTSHLKWQSISTTITKQRVIATNQCIMYNLYLYRVKLAQTWSQLALYISLNQYWVYLMCLDRSDVVRLCFLPYWLLHCLLKLVHCYTALYIKQSLHYIYI